MKDIKKTIETLFRQTLSDNDVIIDGGLSEDMELLKSGLDSLGFAILVTQLERELGYDPFTLMTEAVYPTTYGEFIGIYLEYAPA